VGPTFCAANTSSDEDRFEYQLEDQRIRDDCIRNLRLASNISLAPVNTTHTAPLTRKPFFVGCGFHKPHVPWVVPHSFYASLPRWQDIPLAKDVYAPIDMPPVAWHLPWDVKGFEGGGFNGTCNATLARMYRRAYYGAVAYQDANIGRVLDALDEIDGGRVALMTAVVVFGDHGWQLGEHAVWSKMTNFELGVRIPLIIRAPWKRSSVGQSTDVLAEAVDLYPTLAALVGLPDPRAVVGSEGINGTSLAPIFDMFDPALDGSSDGAVGSSDAASKHTIAALTIKDAAFSQFAKGANESSVWPAPLRNETKVMGYSIRVNEWRYTAWFGFDTLRIVPNTSDVVGTELYDHRGDRCLDLDWEGENVNVATDPSHVELVAGLHQRVLDYIQLWPVGE
jgi:arylsulfatase A-like enzyme